MEDNQQVDQKCEDCKTIMQDGISCPKKPPWDPKVSKITGIPFALILLLGIYILLKVGILELIIWLAAFVIFSYPLRYLVCARCPYYGEDCSSSFGKLAPLMFKKQEG